jgi:hypothetical protein
MIKYKLEFNLSKFLSIFLTLHGSFGSEDLVSWGEKEYFFSPVTIHEYELWFSIGFYLSW